MTEHSKIPVPREDDEQGKANSLIERAVNSFELKKFAPPPVPQKLDPVPKKIAARKREAERREEAMVKAPVVPAIEPMASKPEPVAEEPAPVVSEPVQPVIFSGKKHAIDREHLRDQGMIVPEGSVTALLEEFRIVKRQLLLHGADMRRQGLGSSSQRILVCSPHSGEGKTYCSINLALSFAAEKESDVLLVDADFAKPSILSVLGLPGGPGLMDALINPEADVADFVIGTDIPGLWVLPAGDTSNSDSEHLNSSHTREVIDRLTQGVPHRMVIFNSPPALAASPAAELAKFVAQAVMVVLADKTGQGAIEDALSLLSGCPNIQLLLNAVHFSPSGRRFGSYYGYGGGTS